MNHDIVTIGGSAGSVDVLLELVRDLPADLDGRTSAQAEMLRRVVVHGEVLSAEDAAKLLH